MKEEIKRAAEAFAQSEGGSDRRQHEYDFECGAKYMLRKVFELYLDGNLEFNLGIYE